MVVFLVVEGTTPPPPLGYTPPNNVTRPDYTPDKPSPYSWPKALEPINDPNPHKKDPENIAYGFSPNPALPLRPAELFRPGPLGAGNANAQAYPSPFRAKKWDRQWELGAAESSGQFSPVPEKCRLGSVLVELERPGTSHSAGGYSTLDVISHLAAYTGFRHHLTDEERNQRFGNGGGFPGTRENPDADYSSDRSSASLTNPDMLPIKRSDQHFLGCWDGRSQLAVIGTPGGDVAEFIIGLSVVERGKSLRAAFTKDQVMTYLFNFLSTRDHFYAHTDANSLKLLSEATGIEDPLNPKNLEEIRRVVRFSSYPDHIGCTHLKKLLLDRAYGVRPMLVKNVIEALMEIYLDKSNPMQHKIVYEVMDGYPQEEKAIVNIMSPDPATATETPLPTTSPSQDEPTQSSAPSRRLLHAASLLPVPTLPLPEGTPKVLESGPGRGLGKLDDKKADLDVPSQPDLLGGCTYHSPLVVPGLDQKRQVRVYHPHAVYESRKR